MLTVRSIPFMCSWEIKLICRELDISWSIWQKIQVMVNTQCLLLWHPVISLWSAVWSILRKQWAVDKRSILIVNILALVKHLVYKSYFHEFFWLFIVFHFDFTPSIQICQLVITHAIICNPGNDRLVNFMELCKKCLGTVSAGPQTYIWFVNNQVLY